MTREDVTVTLNFKTFDELSTAELFEIVRSRFAIFVLEQNMHCPEFDDTDYTALHGFLEENGTVMAYLRLFETEAGVVKIGRVLSLVHGKGLGRTIMQAAIEKAKAHFACRKIVVHAQKRAEGFYEKLGFETLTEPYMEDGVLHVTMELQTP